MGWWKKKPKVHENEVSLSSFPIMSFIYNSAQIQELMTWNLWRFVFLMVSHDKKEIN